MVRSSWLLPLFGLLVTATIASPLRAGNLGDAVSPSNQEQLQLAKALKRIGAIFYGAWWCTHCFHQKNLFGTEAGRELPYVECDKTDEGRERCRKAGVKAFPTWILGGKRNEGVMNLKELRSWAEL
jgi:glutaredoxin